MMALSGATPLKLGVDVAGILSLLRTLLVRVLTRTLLVRVLMGNSDVSHIILGWLGGPKARVVTWRHVTSRDVPSFVSYRIV